MCLALCNVLKTKSKIDAVRAFRELTVKKKETKKETKK